MIILDTHAWLWWANESPKLSTKANEIIQAADLIGIPAICCWEIAMLATKSRIELSMDILDWIDLALKRPKIQLLPLTPTIAVKSPQLPGDFHGDPADRLIVATSLIHQSPLVSKDQKIQDWDYIKVIW
jgi:PIN domain nuclease of toxin-antitoxin system